MEFKTDRDLRMWRAGEDITQEEAAKRWGVTKQAYHLWERGKYSMRLTLHWDRVVNGKGEKLRDLKDVWVRFEADGRPVRNRDPAHPELLRRMTNREFEKLNEEWKAKHDADRQRA